MKKQRIGTFLSTFWHHFLFYGLIVLFVGGFLWWQLGTLVPGFSAPELAARASANSFYKLFSNPIFLPHKAMQYIFIRSGHDGIFWMRSVSALWGVAILVVFYDIIASWYSRRIAIMSGALLLTSAWFLHFARLGTPQIMFATSIGLLWIGMKLKSATAPRIRTVLASSAIVVTCLYVPGLAWLIIPLLIWQRKFVWGEIARIPRWLRPMAALTVGVALTPLIWGLAKHPVLIREWLFLPSSVPLGLFWSRAWHIPVWLLFRGPTIPTYWLGHVPMFDSFSIVMGVLGVFVLTYYRLLDRVRAIVVIVALSLLLTILNGWVALVIALPLFYVVIAAGVALFLQQWFTVFPRNPLARTVGIVLVSFVVVLAAYYNVRHYFVAWPRNTETKQRFNLL